VDCIQVVEAHHYTCRVCSKAKQRCRAVWDDSVVGLSSVSALGEAGLKLLERLVTGVDRIGERLEKIEWVLQQEAEDEADEAFDKGLNDDWFNIWQTEDMARELEELNVKHGVFHEFLHQQGQEPEEEVEDEVVNETKNME
jgi:hypothetical protein